MREYSPSLGRWMQVDPTTYRPGDEDLYRFDRNSPVGLTDPLGLDGRHLEPCEKCTVAIFHNALNTLKESEFNSIIKDTTIQTKTNIFENAANMSLAELALALLQKKLYELLVSISFSGGAAAVTIPPNLSDTGKTLIATKKPANACDGGKIKDKGALTLLAHELQHNVQILRTGDGSGDPFISEYLNAYIDNRGNKMMSGQKAYECIPFEIEAYALQNALDVVLTGENIKKFNKVCCDAYTDKNGLSLITDNADAKALAKAFMDEFKKQKAKLEADCKD